MQFEDAATQGYGASYKDLNLAVMACVHQLDGEVKAGALETGELDKMTTKRRLAHILHGIVIRPSADDAEHKKMLQEWGEVQKNYLENKKKCFELGQQGR